MADGTITVQPAASGKDVDNELIGGTVYRQRTRIGGAGLTDLAGCDATNGLDVDVTRSALPAGAATEATLADVLAELGQKYEGEVRPATSAVTSVTASTSSVTLKAANGDRLGLVIYNDSTANLFVKLGVTASATSFTHKMAGGGMYEVPFSYVGVVDAIWDVANGAARVTELT